MSQNPGFVTTSCRMIREFYVKVVRNVYFRLYSTSQTRETFNRPNRPALYQTREFGHGFAHGSRVGRNRKRCLSAPGQSMVSCGHSNTECENYDTTALTATRGDSISEVLLLKPRTHERIFFVKLNLLVCKGKFADFFSYRIRQKLGCQLFSEISPHVKDIVKEKNTWQRIEFDEDLRSDRVRIPVSHFRYLRFRFHLQFYFLWRKLIFL